MVRLKRGRPSVYSPDIGMMICAEVAGGSNLHKLCKRRDIPDRVTIYRWLAANEDFSNNYSRAREDRADVRSERIDAHCEAVKAGKLDPQAARVIIDAEKWQAAHERPKRYGDRTAVEVSGDAMLPVKFIISGFDAGSPALPAPPDDDA